MGIISSTVLKPEHKSHSNNQVPSDTPEKVGDSSSGWRDGFEAFMKGGGCKDAFTDFQDCVDEAEKKKEAIGQCIPMLAKCMETHSDYYQPILAVGKAAEQVLEEAVTKAFMPSIVSLNEINEEDEEKFVTFMKGGDCKESFTAWSVNCNFTEEEENKVDLDTKCAGLFGMLLKCVDAHSDYYQPILDVKKITEEHIEMEVQALFSEASREI